MEKLAIVLGIIALTIGAFSIQTNDKKKILMYQIISNIFYAVQYSIYGAFSAAGMNTFSIIRNFVYYNNEEKQKENTKWQLFVFLIIIMIFGIVTVDSLLGILPIVATLLYTFGTWVKNNKCLRIFYLTAALLWIFYNVSIRAFVPAISDLVEIVFAIVAIVRFDVLKQNKI